MIQYNACVLLNIYKRLQWTCDAKFMCPLFSKDNGNSPRNAKAPPYCNFAYPTFLYQAKSNALNRVSVMPLFFSFFLNMSNKLSVIQQRAVTEGEIHFLNLYKFCFWNFESWSGSIAVPNEKYTTFKLMGTFQSTWARTNNLLTLS